MLKAVGLMTKNLIGLMPGSSMLEAFRIMHTKDIRHLPVFDTEKKLVGILSDRDVIKAMASEGIQPSQEAVSKYMTSPVKVVDLNSPLTEVLSLMVENKISAVMVNDKNDFVGILTTEDLMKSFIGLLSQNEEHAHRPISFFFNGDTLY